MENAHLDWTFAWPDGKDSVVFSEPAVERLRNELPKLPFLSLPFAERLTEQLEALTPWLQGFRHMLLLGIGGSALGPRALQRAFAPGQDRPCHDGPFLWIADNVHPEWLQEHLDKLPPEETLVVAVSKSGGTVETISQYLLVLPWLQKNLPETWKEHLFLVTDERKGFLRTEVDKYGIRSLPVPDDLGGRYSVLSAVGLLPAAFLGMDWKGLLAGALSVGRPLAQNPEILGSHPSWKLARWAFSMSQQGKSQIIFFSYIPDWATFGPWFCQLWAESLGKGGKGTMPLPAVGVTDQHSLLQMFLDGPKDKICLFVTSPADTSILHLPAGLPEAWRYLEKSSFGDILDAESLATRLSLSESGVPLVRLNMPEKGAFYAGKMMMLLEAATVFTGWLLDINPIDQPAVENGKRLARARLGAPNSEEDARRLAALASKPEIEEDF